MHTIRVRPLTIGAAAPCTIPPKKANQIVPSSSLAHAKELTLYHAGAAIVSSQVPAHHKRASPKTHFVRAPYILPFLV